eukprot:6173605-Pleurochrysis_carterae.AAC.2
MTPNKSECTIERARCALRRSSIGMLTYAGKGIPRRRTLNLVHMSLEEKNESVRQRNGEN